MIENTRKCKLAPKKTLCHIHNKSNQSDFIKIIDLEIKNDNLEKKISKMSKVQENAKLELTNLYKTIEKKNRGLKEKDEALLKEQTKSASLLDEISKLKFTLKQQTNKINNMTEDFNNFQVIKKYEKTKQELLKKNIDILSFKNPQFHKLRLDRNYIVHQKTLILP